MTSDRLDRAQGAQVGIDAPTVLNLQVVVEGHELTTGADHQELVAGQREAAGLGADLDTVDNGLGVSVDSEHGLSAAQSYEHPIGGHLDSKGLAARRELERGAGRRRVSTVDRYEQKVVLARSAATINVSSLATVPP